MLGNTLLASEFSLHVGGMLSRTLVLFCSRVFLISNIIKQALLRGLADEKKLFIIHLREKCVKQEIISMCSHPKFVSHFFLKNVKKTNCIENNYILLGVLLLQFHRYNKIDYLFNLQWLGAERHIPILRISEK